MSASLVLVLLLAAVASAQAGSPVSVENKCGKPVKMNGKEVGVGAIVVLDLDLKLAVVLSVLDANNNECSTTFFIPLDVKAVVVVYDGVYIKVKVKAVNFILGLVNTLIGLVLVSLKVVLFLH